MTTSKQYVSDSKYQYVNESGQIHNDNGPAIVDTATNIRRWLINGELHREDGPAVMWNRGEEWWIKDMRHSSVGPAIKLKNGHVEWWIYGERYTFDEWCEQGYYIGEDLVMLKLKYA